MSGSRLKPKICTCEKKRTYLVASAGCADDDAAVASLPDVWVPKHSGPILFNYLKEREQKHDLILKDIADCASVINKDIDDKVRSLASFLLEHIKQKQRNVDCIITDMDSEALPLSKDQRDVALKGIHDLITQRINDMSTFKREALGLERERADKLRNLIRDHFQKLIAVGHQTPKDLLHDFDQRVYDVNQQLLSNTRAYTELEAQLRVQADECMVRARSAINQLCLGIGKSRGHSALPWTRSEQNYLRTSSAQQSTRDSKDSCIGHIIKTVENIDEHVTRLVQTYKSAVMKVFSGFYDKLNDLEKVLECNDYLLSADKNHMCQLQEFRELIDSTLHHLSVSLHKKRINSKDLLEATGTPLMTMQKSLWTLGECLRDTYSILYDAGHLWDAHILRQALAQKLNIASVEDLLTNNDSIELANEVSYNVALEQLRTAPDEDKLQQLYSAVVLMLSRTAEMYTQHSEAELSRLEEYMNLPSVFSKILLSEFDCFLESHPRTQLQSSSFMNHTSSPKFTLASANAPLPRAILQTELQEVALRNWRNGFLETFGNNMSLVPEELRRQAQLWVEERAKALHMRYSLKMVSHSIRLERVNAARDLRLSELQYHESRLQSHLDAIYDLINTLPKEASEFAAVDAPFLYPLCKWVEQMKTDLETFLAKEPINPEAQYLKMSSCAPRIAKHRLCFDESLCLAVEAYKRQNEYRIQNARISNVRFMLQIKLFNEGGRYAAQEAIKTSAALVKGADALEACIPKVLDALNQRRNQLFAAADLEMSALNKIIDETMKTSGRPDAKKKPGKK